MPRLILRVIVALSLFAFLAPGAYAKGELEKGDRMIRESRGKHAGK